MVKPKTLKGFRDFLPEKMRRRQYIIRTLTRAFETYGFEPLETPALEYEEILTGKYGDEGERLMYRFIDHGKRRVSMRYDQTVPLARVVAQYQNDLPMPFKRYQISPVWRAENTQKGRYREFLQCDVDIVGSASNLADAEILSLIYAAYQKLGFTNLKILVNDRSLFAGLPARAVIIIDKLKKIGEQAVKLELKNMGIDGATLDRLLETQPTEQLLKIMQLSMDLGIPEDILQFEPTLARGLDYYTGIIIEVACSDYSSGSLGGGGRYDNLVGIFAEKSIPAVGFAFGFDRTFEAMEALNLFPDLTKVSTTRILVTVFSEEHLMHSTELVKHIRGGGINCELYDNTHDKLEKQLRYADKKGIMYVALLGPDEIKNNTVTIKNLRMHNQQTVAKQDLLKVI